MSKKERDFDSLENYFQNIIVQATNMGAFSFAISTMNELTQMNSEGMETNNNLSEKRETLGKMDELIGDNDS